MQARCPGVGTAGSLRCGQKALALPSLPNEAGLSPHSSTWPGAPRQPRCGHMVFMGAVGWVHVPDLSPDTCDPGLGPPSHTPPAASSPPMLALFLLDGKWTIGSRSPSGLPVPRVDSSTASGRWRSGAGESRALGRLPAPALGPLCSARGTGSAGCDPVVPQSHPHWGLENGKAAWCEATCGARGRRTWPAHIGLPALVPKCEQGAGWGVQDSGACSSSD